MALTLPSRTGRTLHYPPHLRPLLRLQLVLQVLGLIVSLAACSTSQAGSASTPVATRTPTKTAGVTAMSSPPAQTWIPLNGQSSAAVLAAVRQSALFHMVTSAPAGSDGYSDLSRLDAPVLVLGYGTTKEGGSVNASDFFEIPARSSAGLVANVISAQLNSSHTAISIQSVSGADPTPNWPGKLVSASDAVRIVQVQRRTTLRSGTHAQLIYLAAYNTIAMETGQLTWHAGGGAPADPIWLVPGGDGQVYFVGTDAQSYALADLPLQ